MSAKTQQKTKLEIFEETVAYYTEDVSRIARDANDLCCYETEDGRHCAVGRCMIPDSELHIPNGSMRKAKCSVDHIQNLQETLRPEYRGHGSRFWLSMQRLHDGREFWTDEGLSEAGHKLVQQLRKRYQKLCSHS